MHSALADRETPNPTINLPITWRYNRSCLHNRTHPTIHLPRHYQLTWMSFCDQVLSCEHTDIICPRTNRFDSKPQYETCSVVTITSGTFRSLTSVFKHRRQCFSIEAIFSYQCSEVWWHSQNNGSQYEHHGIDDYGHPSSHVVDDKTWNVTSNINLKR